MIGVSRKIHDSDFPHASFTAMPAELSAAEAVQTLIDQAIARFGRIDVVAHLVGGFAGGPPVHETGAATFERMLDMNFKPAFYLLRAVIPHMRQARSGRLIAVGSRTAVERAPGLGAYSASKAALVLLMRTIALENRGLGITANAVLPGTIDTPVSRQAMPDADFSKWVDPRHIAALIRHLASDEGGAVTGAAIPVYGRDV